MSDVAHFVLKISDMGLGKQLLNGQSRCSDNAPVGEWERIGSCARQAWLEHEILLEREQNVLNQERRRHSEWECLGGGAYERSRIIPPFSPPRWFVTLQTSFGMSSYGRMPGGGRNQGGVNGAGGNSMAHARASNTQASSSVGGHVGSIGWQAPEVIAARVSLEGEQSPSGATDR